jgi:sugar/nucleoside kinase (ribokinase family)
MHDFPLQSVSSSLSFPQDRAFISYVDSYDPPLPVAEVQQVKPRCLLVPYLCYGEEAQRLFSAARQQGSVVFMDCQSTQATLQDEQVRKAIQSVDIFAPNDREALLLTGEKTLEGALDCLADLAPLVIVKQGSQGAAALLSQDSQPGKAGSRVVSVPAIHIKVIDTTGAGDCFNAGFIYSHLKGRPLEACLRAGNICGGLSTTARGCQAAPTAPQLEKYLKNK